MEAIVLNKINNDSIVIAWDDPQLGFGRLIIQWNQKTGKYELDSEMMGIDTIIEIMKALPPLMKVEELGEAR